jgi:hypothetical protein
MTGQTEGGQILEKLGDDVPSPGWGVASVEGYDRGAQGPVDAVIASHANPAGVFWEGEFPEMVLNNRNVSSISLMSYPINIA